MFSSDLGRCTGILVDSASSITRARVFRYCLPLRYPLPLKSTRLRERTGLVIELMDKKGQVSYGEAAPLPDFSLESFGDTQKNLIKACHFILASGSYHPDRVSEGDLPSVAFAIESALYGLSIRCWQKAPAVAPLLLGNTSEIRQRLSGWVGEWPEEFKVKVARGTLSEDIDRVSQVLRQLPETVSLRIDGNQRWGMAEAVEFVRGLEKRQGSGVSGRIAYIEEPLGNPRELPFFYQKTGMAYALDESLQCGVLPDLHSFPGLRALVIKPTLVGGLGKCEALIEAARGVKARTIFSSAFESALGVHWLQQLSAFWLPGECPGLDTLSAFSAQLIDRMPEPGQSLPAETLNQMELVWQQSRQ
ncbi:o-succinylbenzoate synthase [Endozoicomonas sp. Mp262]|uniref:o-succinylbenzoate synthase n=1 Tax=Endozoicomonas sp. Mp262 TaxID=2919499 RepID=UPI0021D80557